MLNINTPNKIFLPPLTLYIHFPWCIKKCIYCDFNTYKLSKKTYSENDYINALILDLKYSLPIIQNRYINSIFIGGGTPSLISTKNLRKLFLNIKQMLNIKKNAEITLEANPESCKIHYLSDLRDIGVNRLSLGIQSFNKKNLITLKRSHNVKQSYYAAKITKKIFNNFNFDLMYALPGQTIHTCKSDIETALSFSPPHISIYELTIDNDKLFTIHNKSIQEEDLLFNMKKLMHNMIIKSGYNNYEISSYAKRNKKCKHNINYFSFGDYLGIGAGAHTKLSFSYFIKRQVRYKNPIKFISQSILNSSIEKEYNLNVKDIILEFMINSLRLKKGFLIHDFIKKTGLSESSIKNGINKAIFLGFIKYNKKKIIPTKLGQLFLNDLQICFL